MGLPGALRCGPWIGGAVVLALLASPARGTVIDGTPWSGSQDQGGATAAPGDTNRIDLVFDPAKSELTTPCEEIVLIQVLQICVNGNPVDPGVYWDGWEFQDADSTDDLPDTPADETGTHVDSFKTSKSPAYPGPHTPGSSNGTSHNSSIQDAPRSGALAPGTSMKYKFETCAFCAKGEDIGHYFGCILWEYSHNAADQAAGKPGTSTITGTANQPSPGFTAAVDQWSANHDYDQPRGY